MLSAGVRLRGVNILHAMENSWDIPCQAATWMKEVCMAGWRPKKVISQASHKWISSYFELKKAGGRDMGVGDEEKYCTHSPSVQAVTPRAIVGGRVLARQIFSLNQSSHSHALLEALQRSDHRNYKEHQEYQLKGLCGQH